MRWLTPTIALSCLVAVRRLTVSNLQLKQVCVQVLPWEKREHRGQVR
jgi:hypothetical protein